MLSVVLHHFVIRRPVFSSGWVGVDIFFVLSGFLITGILYDSRHKKHRVRDFYVRRVLRIFPLYYGVWLAIALSTSILRWKWDPIWLLWPAHLGNYNRLFCYVSHCASQHDNLITTSHSFYVRTLLPFLSVGHFWSLCVEEQFYLVWPLVVFRMNSRKALIQFAVFVIASVLLLRIVLLFTLPKDLLVLEFLYNSTPTRADAFMYGALIALFLRGPEKSLLTRFRTSASIAAFFVFIVSVTLQLSVRHVTSLDPRDPFVSTIGYCIIDLCAALLLLNALHVNSWIYRVLSVPWLRWLGGISYGVYVFHLMLLPLANSLSEQAPFLLHFRVPIGIGLTLLLAQLSHTFYEKPFLRLKDRFSSQVHRTPAA